MHAFRPCSMRCLLLEKDWRRHFRALLQQGSVNTSCIPVRHYQHHSMPMLLCSIVCNDVSTCSNGVKQRVHKAAEANGSM